jgi:hypothetical protein
MRDLQKAFGVVTDYYPEEEVDSDMRASWRDSAAEWARAVRRARSARRVVQGVRADQAAFAAAFAADALIEWAVH